MNTLLAYTLCTCAYQGCAYACSRWFTKLHYQDWKEDNPDANEFECVAARKKAAQTGIVLGLIWIVTLPWLLVYNGGLVLTAHLARALERYPDNRDLRKDKHLGS